MITANDQGCLCNIYETRAEWNTGKYVRTDGDDAFPLQFSLPKPGNSRLAFVMIIIRTVAWQRITITVLKKITKIRASQIN